MTQHDAAALATMIAQSIGEGLREMHDLFDDDEPKNYGVPGVHYFVREDGEPTMYSLACPDPVDVPEKTYWREMGRMSGEAIDLPLICVIAQREMVGRDPSETHLMVVWVESADGRCRAHMGRKLAFMPNGRAVATDRYFDPVHARRHPPLEWFAQGWRKAAAIESSTEPLFEDGDD